MGRIAIARKVTVRDNDGRALSIHIVFTDGRKVEVNIHDLLPDMQLELIAHGLAQKLGDAYSGAKGNMDFAYAEASSVAEALERGDWTRRGEGTGGILLEAIVNLTGQSIAAVLERLAEMDKDAKAALRKRKDIKAEMKSIEAERAKAKVETSKDEASLDDLF